MSSDARDKEGGAPGGRPSRDERRAAALRDNLKRRKIQARGRAEGASEVPRDEEAGRRARAGQDGVDEQRIDDAGAAAARSTSEA